MTTTRKTSRAFVSAANRAHRMTEKHKSKLRFGPGRQDPDLVEELRRHKEWERQARKTSTARRKPLNGWFTVEWREYGGWKRSMHTFKHKKDAEEHAKIIGCNNSFHRIVQIAAKPRAARRKLMSFPELFHAAGLKCGPKCRHKFPRRQPTPKEKVLREWRGAWLEKATGGGRAMYAVYRLGAYRIPFRMSLWCRTPAQAWASAAEGCR